MTAYNSTYTGAQIDNAVAAAKNLAQCILAYTNTTTLTLSPRNGNRVPVKIGTLWYLKELASAGITVDTTGLAADTTYFVYCDWNGAGSTLRLSLSTTGHSTDSDTGVEIRTGDPTQTLVGMARTNGSTQFSAALTLSWFNRAIKTNSSALTVARTTASATAVELNSEIQVGFLVWSGRRALCLAFGAATNNNAAGSAETTIGIDGVTGSSATKYEQTATVSEHAPFAVQHAAAPTEGYHYATLAGNTNGTGTGSWRAGATLTVLYEG